LLLFKEAVDNVIEEHSRLGLPLYVLRNGNVVAASAQTDSSKIQERRENLT
jgi:hypothetical protein